MNLSSIISMFFLLVLNLDSVEHTNTKHIGDDKIQWTTDRLLSWQDFKATPNESSKFSAESSLQISYGMKISKGSDGTKVAFKVECYFEPGESWVKKNLKTETLLAHEQLHFDIAEIFARKLRKRFNESTFTIDNYNTKSTAIFEKVFLEYKSYQAAYDHDSKHGSDREEQLNWNKSVASMLVKSTKYKN